MCGIAALARRRRPLDDHDRGTIELTLERLAHRGPDGGGLWSDSAVALGHRRLSIIDLSSAGDQPFHDSTAHLHVVFNGEIYNYRELRPLLEQKGATFTSSSDTEVLLKAYAAWGGQWLERLLGMFAFVLYDQRRRTLLLARDRVGKKPLYYYLDDELMFVASELKTFRCLPDVDLEIDADGASAFFGLQYVPGPGTIYRNVRLLRPGHLIELDLTTWRLVERCYWELHAVAPPGEDASRELERALERSVDLRLIADVEVGALLSGGIDSSLLCAIAAARSADPLRAFSVGFSAAELDESPFAREVAQSLGLQLIELEGDRVDADLVTKVAWYGDQPLADPACVPVFQIAQAMRGQVKVVLSGEGADEVFLGYGYQQRERAYQRFGSRLAALLPREGALPGTALLESDPRFPTVVSRAVKLLGARELGVARWTGVFGQGSLRKLLPEVAPSNGGWAWTRAMAATRERLERVFGPVEGSLALDFVTWLPDDLLAKVDRMTMAHGIEARTPYLDHRLVELAFALRAAPRTAAAMRGKGLLREIAKRRLPPGVAARIASRPKQGFRPPYQSWLRGELRDLAESLFAPEALANVPFLDAAYVGELWRRFHRHRDSPPFSRKIWALFCFCLWCRLDRERHPA